MYITRAFSGEEVDMPLPRVVGLACCVFDVPPALVDVWAPIHSTFYYVSSDRTLFIYGLLVVVSSLFEPLFSGFQPSLCCFSKEACALVPARFSRPLPPILRLPG